MHAVCEGFDDFFSRWYPDIRRLCFAMTENDKDARNLAFKTFLRLGAAKDPQIKENDAKFLLFQAASRSASITSAESCAVFPAKRRLRACPSRLPLRTIYVCS